MLPFILRRTKEASLPELPPKIIIDEFCPLSKLQRRLYVQFQHGLQLSDARLEKEVIDKLPTYVSSLVKADMASGQCHTADPVEALGPVDIRSYHPFQAISYLKRLCVHPSLISDQCESADRVLLEEDDGGIFSSGKLCRLVDILVEQQLVRFTDDASRIRLAKSLLALSPGGSAPGLHMCGEGPLEDSDGESVSSRDDSSGEEGGEEGGVEGGDGNSDKEADIAPSLPPELSGRQKKCLIFAEHRATLNIIRDYVFGKYFPHERLLLLDGRMGALNRAQLVEEFNTGNTTDTPNILLLTVASCGLGLNLSAAEVVIFVEHSWNPFVDLQAMDRVHRIGQQRTTTVYRLLGRVCLYRCHLD